MVMQVGCRATSGRRAAKARGARGHAAALHARWCAVHCNSARSPIGWLQQAPAAIQYGRKRMPRVAQECVEGTLVPACIARHGRAKLGHIKKSSRHEGSQARTALHQPSGGLFISSLLMPSGTSAYHAMIVYLLQHDRKPACGTNRKGQVRGVQPLHALQQTFCTPCSL